MHTNNNQRDSGVLLWRAANAWQRAIRAALRPHGLTQGQYMLLRAVAAAPSNAPIQRQVAAYVGLDTAAASTLVGQVAARGWLSVRTADADARAKVLALTATGRSLVAAAEADIAAATDHFFDPLRGDRAAFSGALAVLIGLRPRLSARQAPRPPVDQTVR